MIQLIYLVSAALFILSLMWMSHPSTARRGVFAGVVAMVAAIGGTLLLPEISSYTWIIVAIVVGLHPRRALGDGAADGRSPANRPLARLRRLGRRPGGSRRNTICRRPAFVRRSPAFETGALVAEVILGFLTFTGSLMAAGKLMEIIPTRPITYKGQNAINLSLLGVAILAGVLLVVHPGWWPLFPIIILLSLAFGVLLIIPIGGADMPTVIALLNAYAGLSAVAMGFVLNNKLLIAAGALDGSSGLILSIIMCKAMNRSFANVLFGAFGQVQATTGTAEQRTVKSATAEDAAQIMERRATRRHHPRLRHGRGPGPAPRARAVRRADQRGRRREVRHPSGRRPHARAT